LFSLEEWEMKSGAKEALSTALVSVGWRAGTVVWWVTAIVPWLRSSGQAGKHGPASWAEATMALASACLVAGALVGSRRLGRPLTLKLLLSLLAMFPSCILMAAYLTSFTLVFLSRM
jgi:hypothetical protein